MKIVVKKFSPLTEKIKREFFPSNIILRRKKGYKRRKMRKTKIVCTIGPSSNNPDVLEKLIKSGMDVARLNFSHGSKDEHRQTLNLIRSIAKDLAKPVAILQDLPGPKLRIGHIVGEEVSLHKGDSFSLTLHPVEGDMHKVSVNYSFFIQNIQVGDILLLADGAVQLQVAAKRPEEIKCKVLVGGALSSRKGIKVPAKALSVPAFTEEDEEYLHWGMEHGVDFVAFSEISRAEDLYRAKKLLEKNEGNIQLIAKIETAGAIEHFDEIIDLVDGIMIARGDLGIEIPLENVPITQKELIKKANLKGKPVITATQMLKSMTENPLPTRAEVTDVANAVLDGSDAVMLSEETAIGKYPEETVQMMANIIREAEKAFPFGEKLNQGKSHKAFTIEEAISHAACDMADKLKAQVIISPTESALTARLLSK